MSDANHDRPEALGTADAPHELIELISEAMRHLSATSTPPVMI